MNTLPHEGEDFTCTALKMLYCGNETPGDSVQADVTSNLPCSTASPQLYNWKHKSCLLNHYWTFFPTKRKIGHILLSSWLSRFLTFKLGQAEKLDFIYAPALDTGNIGHESCQ